MIRFASPPNAVKLPRISVACDPDTGQRIISIDTEYGVPLLTINIDDVGLMGVTVLHKNGTPHAFVTIGDDGEPEFVNLSAKET